MLSKTLKIVNDASFRTSIQYMDVFHLNLSRTKEWKKKKIGETKGGRITLCQNKNQSYEFHPYVSKLKD